MQNGSRKTIDTRYTSIYTSKRDGLKGEQLPGKISRTPPADRKAEYPLEYGNKKK